MDSLGDYIYLIIIIIAAISGIFKKKKTPTSIPIPQQDYEEKEEMIKIPQKVFVPEEIVKEKYKNYEVNYQPLSYDNATDFSKLKAQKQVVITSKFAPNEIQTSTEEEEFESEYKFRSLDDVRKAVIFSEILNRKYIF